MRNVHELFAATAARFAGRTAIEVVRRDGVESCSYADLVESVEAAAAWLTSQSVGPGDRCCILAENDADWCAAYLAVLRVGAVAVPLDTSYSAGQLATLFRDSTPRLIFTTPRHAHTAREGLVDARHGATLVLFSRTATDATSWAEVRGCAAGRAQPCPANASDIAVILYTSGTTADPKGVMLTHGNLLAEREAVFRVVSADQSDCILGVLPLFHALAQIANLLLPLSIGGRVVFLETVSSTELLRALSERGVTLFACVPQFYYLIHERIVREVDRAGALRRAGFRVALGTNALLRRLGVNAGRWVFGRVHRALGGRMRLMVTGGSRFDPAIGRDLYNLGFDIVQAYGLTETSGAATLMRPGDSHVWTVGHPLPGVQIRIRSEEAGDSEAGGEVLIRGPVVMAGYFNRPDATAAAIRDGWLHTGDLGYVDANGRVTLTGRSKELIVLSSGKNIHPEEVEAHYRQSPFIKELCVLGLTRPGEPAAERLYAVVVLDSDVLRERRIVNTGEVLRFELEGLSIGLPAHKRVLGYRIWREPLPRTSTGKLKRFEIERRLAREQADASVETASATMAEDAWSASPDVAPVIAVIQSAAHGRPVSADANLELDLGLDSMERVELLASLELRLGARIPEAAAQELHTVRELVEAVLKYRSATGPEDDGDAWQAILSEKQGIDSRVAEIARVKPFATAVLFGVLHLLLWSFRRVVRIEVSGLEHLPERGPYIVSPNHQSFLDPFIVVGQLPFRVVRDLFFVGASEYFEGPVLEWLARQCNIVPVDPDAALVSAMQASASGLRLGKVLVLFPEGERSIDGTVKAFKKGAAILSHQLEVPIVPVAIDGIYDVWPRNRPINWSILRPWHRARVLVRFGPAIDAAAPELAGAASFRGPLPLRIYERTTARLRAEVGAMWSDIHAERTGEPPRIGEG